MRASHLVPPNPEIRKPFFFRSRVGTTPAIIEVFLPVVEDIPPTFSQSLPLVSSLAGLGFYPQTSFLSLLPWRGHSLLPPATAIPPVDVPAATRTGGQDKCIVPPHERFPSSYIDRPPTPKLEVPSPTDERKPSSSLTSLEIMVPRGDKCRSLFYLHVHCFNADRLFFFLRVENLRNNKRSADIFNHFFSVSFSLA